MVYGLGASQVTGPGYTAPIIVDELTDWNDGFHGDGELELREALAIADAINGTSEIVFDYTLFPSYREIALRDSNGDGISEELLIGSNVSISGPGAELLGISGNDTGRVMLVLPGVDVNLSDITITEGAADTGAGILNLGRLTVTDSVITENHATSKGGGIYTVGTAAELHVIGSRVELNTAIHPTTTYEGAGGGIFIEGGKLYVESSTISENTASYYGGGIGTALTSSSLTVDTLEIVGSTIWGNQAQFVGGAAIMDVANSSVKNSTFSDNSADGSGGGLYYALESGQVGEVVNSTIAYNESTNYGAGGIVAYGVGPLITNTIIAKNTRDNGLTPMDVDGAFNTGSSHNIIEVLGTANGLSNSSQVDPLLLPLGDYGGGTSTHAIDPASPAVDAGSDAAATAAGIIVDQRSGDFQRTVAGAIDIGSVESHLIEEIDGSLTFYGFEVDDVQTLSNTGATAISDNSFLNRTFNPATVPKVRLEGLGGADRLAIDEAYTLGAELSGGTGSDWLIGGSGADVIEGGAGNDRINGMGGDDTLSGGSGDDSYVFATTGELLGNDTVFEAIGEGEDVLDYSEADIGFGITLDLQSNALATVLEDGSSVSIHGLYPLENEEIEGVIGTLANDQILGNQYANFLHGNDGDDQLDGREGDDALYGGDGDDDLQGGAGSDSLSGGAGNDNVVGGGGSDETESEAENDNVAPEVEQAPNLSGRLGQTRSTRIIAEDTETPTSNLVFIPSITGGPGTLEEGYNQDYHLVYPDSLASPPVFEWHPRDGSEFGTYTVEILVYDDDPNPLSTPMSFTATLERYNEAPPVVEISSVGPDVLDSGGGGSFNVTLDPDGTTDDQTIGISAIDSQTANVDLVYGGDLNSAGEIVFDPDSYKKQTPSFSIEVSDDGAGTPNVRSREHTIYVAVIQDDPALSGSEEDRFDPADAEDAAAHTAANTPITINLDAQAFHSPSTVTNRTFNVGSPSYGMLSAVTDGLVTYTPPTDFEGLAQFTWSFDAPHPNTVGEPVATSNTATFYIEVGRAVTVNLTAEGLTEASEEQGGTAYLALNDDQDNGTSLLDLEIVDGPVPGEDDLIEVSVDVALTRSDAYQDDYLGHFVVTGLGGAATAGTNRVRLWTDEQKTTEIIPERAGSINGPKGHYFTFAELQQLGTIYVEGIGTGRAELKLIVEAPASSLFTDEAMPIGYEIEGVTSDEDAVNFGVVTLDLDIDSDNTGLINGSAWEELLEDNQYGLGKLVLQSSVLAGHTPPATLADFTPVQLKLPAGLDATDPALTVRIDFFAATTAGVIKVWTLPKDDLGRIDADANNGGHRVLEGGEYTLDKLNYSAATGLITLYIDGAKQSNIVTLKELEDVGKPQETIKATLTNVAGGNVSDEVKYIVTNPRSIFWELQTRPELRSELAARGVYNVSTRTSADLPDFSLRQLTYSELIEIGLRPDIAQLLTNFSGVNGFAATLYQDYITGPNQFNVAFAGTDDLLDWVVNVFQGFGVDATQYLAAQQIGFELLQKLGIGNVVGSGHSLGGGLASAAAVAGGIPTHTFNAAGLNVNTLFDEFGEIIPGAYNRYQAANTFITAHYVDWDVLSFVQDHSLGVMPTAIGFRVKYDGPYDVAVGVLSPIAAALEAAALVVSIPGGPVAGAVTAAAGLAFGAWPLVQSHLHPAILYGLLVDESTGLDLLGYEFSLLGPEE